MLNLIYETEDFLALNKPAGVLVHKTAAMEENTLIDEVLKQYPLIAKVGDSLVRPGLVHRLDKDTSGVLVVAKNQPFFEYLKDLFQKHEVRKVYLALVWGELKGRGVVNAPIGLKPGTVKRSIRGRNLKMVKAAVTEYKAVKTIEKDGETFTLVELFPKTGRTHQLRVHLASINHPVVGDTLYGRKKNPWSLQRQFLHAESIEFRSRDGKRVKLEADLPQELKKIID
ncbi:MAG: Pseudouridine synthase [Candidatus Jorgensenbacteria bacterium GW2011_GWA1_48_11]|uniref:Pseudouridine synthase n=1 Tax=Candidatus Jorgensenbacteria bacterium GW2011_GWA1_48_11 TaxID=1618660 RepID=A0A0G1WKG6_9BACT|nr:MAG: Pseudouridine synthase [Candidatus Jorgensenbacteria bacterium GW2011_GWA1_48_11]KKW12395.1 MAG: Pseudouridine synthase [Candidatus Jorgensenbacteria bacterium GW2011_GWB1_49_9]